MEAQETNIPSFLGDQDRDEILKQELFPGKSLSHLHLFFQVILIGSNTQDLEGARNPG